MKHDAIARMAARGFDEAEHSRGLLSQNTMWNTVVGASCLYLSTLIALTGFTTATEGAAFHLMVWGAIWFSSGISFHAGEHAATRAASRLRSIYWAERSRMVSEGHAAVLQWDEDMVVGDETDRLTLRAIQDVQRRTEGQP